MSPLGLHPQCFQPDRLGIRNDADRDDDVTEIGRGDLAILALDRSLDARGRDVEGFSASTAGHA